jgi:hypothetical protein
MYREFGEVETEHFRLDLNGVCSFVATLNFVKCGRLQRELRTEHLAVVDTNDGADHLGHNDC